MKKVVRVTGSSEEEAMERINSTDNHGISVVRKIDFSEGFNHLKNFNKQQYIYECEFYFKQISYLEYLLNIALNSYRAKSNYVANNNRTINLINDYENSDELKTYQERMAENGITQELFDEYENNKDFDFNLLNELYQRAKKCFKLVLMSETIHYESVKDNPRVYKLGEKR